MELGDVSLWAVLKVLYPTVFQKRHVSKVVFLKKNSPR